MPQFILDHGTTEASKRFKELDSFTQGYIEALFFTECHSDNPELTDATLHDLAPETWDRILDDCCDFQNLETFQQLREIMPPCYDEDRAGNDFWYTRNGHGTGFWDRDLGDVGKRLSIDAKSFGSPYVYRGDDGKIYLG